MRRQRGFFGISSSLYLVGGAAVLGLLVGWAAFTWWLWGERNEQMVRASLARQSAEMWEAAHDEQAKLLRASEDALAARDEERRRLRRRYVELENELEEVMDDEEVETWARKRVPDSVAELLRNRGAGDGTGDEGGDASAGADG